MERSIDLPLESLTPVDEHGVLVLADPEVVWDALITVFTRTASRPGFSRGANALGCSETEISGEPGQIGSTVPGFVVARAVRPAVFALEGQHRFSTYGLVFRLEATRDDRTLLRAETRAEFPGLKGRAYRTLVIGSRSHVVVVGRMLRAVRRRAERVSD